MATDDLMLACRLGGLSLGDLWSRYLGIGGSRSQAELALRLAGAPWPESEDRFLAVVADEALRESELPPLVEPALPELHHRGVAGPGAPQDHRRSAAAVLAAHARATRLTALFERCGRARAHARDVREHAESVRRGGRASARRVGG
ncbi:hypothetical protein SAMN05660464_2514 [Geodermatophilus dictyosporus]|uniref:Uncharacterized protein n=1 Tax=Geodermatophilus dictyosporus TaxID=1523247 RepID=A0A1I5NHI6_9ACTN|nr:hypothetical protein [Geodermatophilus dictyosporus]SFP21172.1 hypothetical protein SAMN05660464_2514 [Geodermatophilus dictyosporus]